MENQDYEFKTKEEVPEFLDGYVDRDMIEKQHKTPFILKILKFFGNIFTFGLISRIENKKYYLQELEKMNAEKYKSDNENSKASKEDVMSETATQTNSSKEEKENMQVLKSKPAAIEEPKEEVKLETKTLEENKTEENSESEQETEEKSLE